MYMYKVGVMGDKDTVLAFKALGLNTFPVTEPDEAKRTLRALARDRYAVIFITEQMASKIEDMIEEYQNEILPAIILIPNNQGSLGIGMQKIKESVERAIGVDIIFEREGEEN
jgi:V/A-type H+-transporting ATPase subunit F